MRQTGNRWAGGSAGRSAAAGRSGTGDQPDRAAGAGIRRAARRSGAGRPCGWGLPSGGPSCLGAPDPAAGYPPLGGAERPWRAAADLVCLARAAHRLVLAAATPGAGHVACERSPGAGRFASLRVCPAGGTCRRSRHLGRVRASPHPVRSGGCGHRRIAAAAAGHGNCRVRHRPAALAVDPECRGALILFSHPFGCPCRRGKTSVSALRPIRCRYFAGQLALSSVEVSRSGHGARSRIQSACCGADSG